MIFPIAILVGLLFGGGDQYLGSVIVSGGWTESVSLMSAPWLVLPFAFGCTQARARRAAQVGLVVTLSALAGYFLMIMGPLEGGRWTMTASEARGLLSSNRENILGGFITAPLYGLLGRAWRDHRAWFSAVAVAGALCLEPLVLAVSHRDYAGRIGRVALRGRGRVRPGALLRLQSDGVPAPPSHTDARVRRALGDIAGRNHRRPADAQRLVLRWP